MIAKSDSSQVPAGQHGVELEIVGNDRVGILSNVTHILAEAGMSIEHIHTEIVGTTPSAPRTSRSRRTCSYPTRSLPTSCAVSLRPWRPR